MKFRESSSELEHVDEESFVQAHHSSHKGLQMEDGLGACGNAMLEEGGRRDHFRFEFGVEFGKEFECECADDDVRRDAVAKELIELLSSFQHSLGALFLDDIQSNRSDDQVPIRQFDVGIAHGRIAHLKDKSSTMTETLVNQQDLHHLHCE